MTNSKPKVSVGMPVYNGEKYLKEAIDSILSQTFEDFELIISDNASTDQTECICRNYAFLDSRIRYYRNEQNMGAAYNYNRVFELSQGEYFKWAAHDDFCSPEFLERCVEILDRDNSIVLCYPQTKIINEIGEILREHHTKYAADSLSAERRFCRLIYENSCYQVFGLIRSAILKKTKLIEGYAHGDGVLLVKLGLWGRFYEIPEYLFYNREHPQMSMQIARSNYHMYSAWFDPRKNNKIGLPRWRRFFEYHKSIWEVSLSWKERLWCYRHLLAWFKGKYLFLQEDLIIASLKYLQDCQLSINNFLVFIIAKLKGSKKAKTK